MLERVMIIAGESSGELYGALLAKTLIEQNPGILIYGTGGQKMQAAGVKLISGIASAFGISEALKALRQIRQTFAKVKETLKTFQPQILILIDYPDFNLKVAKEAKKLGIKVLYYVSPQIWAWRSGRIKTIGRLIDKMAVILPFEEAIYREAGIPCEFVGHPVFDEIRDIVNDSGFGIQDIGNDGLKTAMKKQLKIPDDKKVLTLMPGSRRHEIETLMPVISEVMQKAGRLYLDSVFAIPLAPNLDASSLADMRNISGNFGEKIFFTDNAVTTLLASDAAVIASGTSTFQAAMLGTPAVVIYKVSPLTYFILKPFVKVDYISLANIILEKSVRDNSGLRIKELMQKKVNTANVMTELRHIMENEEYRTDMLKEFGKIRELFASKHASMRVAQIAKELAG
jgi:lipid-A-disaccharide synthase